MNIYKFGLKHHSLYYNLSLDYYNFKTVPSVLILFDYIFIYYGTNKKLSLPSNLSIVITIVYNYILLFIKIKLTLAGTLKLCLTIIV